MDLEINPLPARTPSHTGALLGEFRKRLAGTGWGHETPDTLLMPLFSPAASVTALGERLSALFRAHLRALHAMRTGRADSGPAKDYARLAGIVQRYYGDWPVIGPGTAGPLDALLADRTASLLYGRPDIVLTADGPKVVETNFDTAVAGFERPDDMWTIAADLFGVPAAYGGRPLHGIRDYFAELAGPGGRLVRWIMRGGDQVRGRYDAVTAELNRNGDGVRHRVHYADDPLPLPPGGLEPALLHRACSVFTMNRDRDRFAALLAALEPSTRGCTVPLDLSQLSSKLYLAWLSDPAARPDSLTDAERDAVRTLVPWTRVPALLGPDDMAKLRRDRDQHVLKKADSHQAREVHFGWTLDDREWTALLRRATAEPPVSADGTPSIWIVQERVRPRLRDLVEITDEGAVRRRTGLSCCPYLMGGKVRGLETWLTPETPDLDMIRRMHFAPHFVRT